MQMESITKATCCRKSSESESSKKRNGRTTTSWAHQTRAYRKEEMIREKEDMAILQRQIKEVEISQSLNVKISAI